MRCRFLAKNGFMLGQRPEFVRHVRILVIAACNLLRFVLWLRILPWLFGLLRLFCFMVGFAVKFFVRRADS